MPGHKKYALFIGRWQPFHRGHQYIIDKALEEEKNVAIAVRDTELSEKNPYTVEQRIEMIQRVYGNRVHVFPIVDIESVNIGRNVGYEVNRIEVPESVGQISATDARANGPHAAPQVPEEVREYIATISPTYWFVGLPCSGKTTLAKQLKQHIVDKNRRVIHFDGDALRRTINQDLGFSEEDRKENLRRAAHMAALFNEQGHTVACSFITPTREVRDMVSSIISNLTFVYTKASIETCKQRDVKGMYKEAEEGKRPGFTGVDASFEEPAEDEPHIVVDTENQSEQEALEQILEETGQA